LKTPGDVIENNFSSTSGSRLLDFSPMRLGGAKTGKGISEIAG